MSSNAFRREFASGMNPDVPRLTLKILCTAPYAVKVTTVQPGKSSIYRKLQAYYLSLLRPAKSLAPLLAVTPQCIGNDRVRLRRRPDVIDLNRFTLELFVVLKEAAQHQQAV